VDNYRSGNAPAIAAMDRLKALAFEMKNALVLGRVPALGELLHEAWEAKKQMATGISTPQIDELYDEARKAGALGGKIPGAGGGGFMFFICKPGSRFAVQAALQKGGAQIANFKFTHEGVRSWTV
jgi:D-glycero-alpha-D-manno-heptose-7-phosphate kinase